MNTESKTQIRFSPENESKAIAWLQSRGGIAVWRNVNMSSQSLGSESYTPALTDGQPTGKPSWQFAFDRIIIDPAEVLIEGKREVARVRVMRGKYGPPADPIARGRQGLDKAMSAAGPDAWWEFDYSNPDLNGVWCHAVIYVPDNPRALVMPTAPTEPQSSQP